MFKANHSFKSTNAGSWTIVLYEPLTKAVFTYGSHMNKGGSEIVSCSVREATDPLCDSRGCRLVLFAALERLEGEPWYDDAEEADAVP